MAIALVAIELGSLWLLVARRALICLAQAAKKILAKIFRARLEKVEEMIQSGWKGGAGGDSKLY